MSPNTAVLLSNTAVLLSNLDTETWIFASKAEVAAPPAMIAVPMTLS
jgi:hypothetical protein